MKIPMNRRSMKRLRYVANKTIEDFGCNMIYFTLKENPGADELEIIVYYKIGTKPILHNMKFITSCTTLEDLCKSLEHLIKDKIETYKFCVLDINIRRNMCDKLERKSN